jgi:hypothetical protein
VAERPGVKVLADLAQEFAVLVEFQQLRRRRGIGRPGGIAAREKEDVAFGIDRDARYFPRYMFAGSRTGLGTESNGMRGAVAGGTCCCADAGPANNNSPISQRFMRFSRCFVLALMLVDEKCWRPPMPVRIGPSRGA